MVLGTIRTDQVREVLTQPAKIGPSIQNSERFPDESFGQNWRFCQRHQHEMDTMEKVKTRSASALCLPPLMCDPAL